MEKQRLSFPVPLHKRDQEGRELATRPAIAGVANLRGMHPTVPLRMPRSAAPVLMRPSDFVV